MKKQFRFLYILFIASLMLMSCNRVNKAQIYSLAGYFSWQQNNWVKATSNFYSSMEISKALKNNELKNYTNFNLASTYLMQNEDISADNKLKNIKNSKNKQLQSSVAYQKGILAFKKQNYKDAIKFFKESIEYAPTNIDAKINYELSKKYLDSEENKTKTTKKNKMQKDENDKINSEIVNLIIKKEEAKWKQEKPQQNILNDY